jgi:hypothetical protein
MKIRTSPDDFGTKPAKAGNLTVVWRKKMVGSFQENLAVDFLHDSGLQRGLTAGNAGKRGGRERLSDEENG